MAILALLESVLLLFTPLGAMPNFYVRHGMLSGQQTVHITGARMHNMTVNRSLELSIFDRVA